MPACTCSVIPELDGHAPLVQDELVEPDLHRASALVR